MESTIRIEIMVKYLKKRSAVADKKTFNAWMYDQIDTDECIRQFRENNDITERMPIIKDEFVQWLGTLGYRKGETDGEEAAID